MLVIFRKTVTQELFNLENVDNILGVIMVSISSRRILYLN